jgi:large subunit ribosomal protein L18
MDKGIVKTERRNRIRRRIRAKVAGTAERPRLSIFKSNKHVTLQLIDDLKGVTLLGLSTNSGAVSAQVKGMTATEAAKVLGTELAKGATAMGVTQAVYDRGGYRYHGVVKAAAEGAREAGLQF